MQQVEGSPSRSTISPSSGSPSTICTKREDRYKVLYGQNHRVRLWAGGEYRWSHLETTIALARDGELVAAAGYTDYVEGGSISGHIVIRGRINRRFIDAILRYPFGQLKVRRLSALIPAKNIGVKGFIEHIGFTYESTHERVLPDDDLLVYRFFREDWVPLL